MCRTAVPDVPTPIFQAVAVMVVAAAAVEMARWCIMEAVHSQRGQ
jgi:hypothetical protein